MKTKMSPLEGARSDGLQAQNILSWGHWSLFFSFRIIIIYCFRVCIVAKPLHVCKIEDLDSQRGVKDISWLAIGKEKGPIIQWDTFSLHLLTFGYLGLVIYRNFPENYSRNLQGILMKLCISILFW